MADRAEHRLGRRRAVRPKPRLGRAAADGGDIRGGETSLVGQAKFLLESPLNIVKVGFEHIMNALLNYNWYTDLNHATFFGKYSTQIFFMELIFIIYISCTDEYVEIKKRTQIVSIITFLGVFASTSLMLYLTFIYIPNGIHCR